MFVSFSFLIGVKNTAAKKLVIDVEFNDGTKYSDVLSFNWITGNDLLTFSTSDNQRIDIDTAGTATLKDNWWTTVDLTAQAKCTVNGVNNVQSVNAVKPNLSPASWDMDVQDSVTGLQFPAANNNDQRTWNVYINAVGGNLISFDVKVFYDATFLTPVSCSQGTDWSDAQFEVNTDGKISSLFIPHT